MHNQKASVNAIGAPSAPPSTIGFRPDPEIWDRLNRARGKLAEEFGLSKIGRGLSNQELLTELLKRSLDVLGC